MKLLTKTTLYIITIALFVFFVCGIGFFVLFSRLMDNWVNKELMTEMHNIQFDVQKHGIKPYQKEIAPFKVLECKKLAQRPQSPITFSDTIIFIPFSKLYVPHRKLKFTTISDNQLYCLTIQKSLFSTNRLVEYVALGMTITIILFIICLYFLNKYFFKRIWSDFFETLETIKQFDISESNEFKVSDSMITEFEQLNLVLQKMTHRIRRDYSGLKEFTGNLSHEIRTPLAIVQSKIEMLIQTEGLNDNQLKLLGEIHSGASRLSRLNHSIMLLTKIENQQYHEIMDVDFGKKIKTHLSHFEDMIDDKEIELVFDAKNPFIAQINTELADILVINLLKNAIRHNIHKGKLHVTTSHNGFSVCNSGKPLEISEKKLFDRFAKNPNNKNSIGLGLAIVKKICDNYGFSISYDSQNGLHCFTISKKQ